MASIKALREELYQVYKANTEIIKIICSIKIVIIPSTSKKVAAHSGTNNAIDNRKQNGRQGRK